MSIKDVNIIYSKLIENMNEAVWMGDEYEKTVYANSKFCNLVEYTLDEMLGKESYIFWDQESSERVKNVNLNERKKGVSSSYEGNLLTKKGKKIPVRLNGTPLPDGGTIGIMTDLRELKEKESIYKKLVENMNEAVWMGDKNEKTVYANPKFCDLLEYTLDEIIGVESYIFWDNESSKRVKNINKNKRKNGISSSYEGNLLTKNGVAIPVLLNGTPLPDGGTIGIMTDLRKLKEKEENERILLNAVNYSTDAMIIFDEKGIIKSWNKGSEIMFSYKNDEIIGKKIGTILYENEVKILLKDTGVVYKHDLKGKSKNNTILNISTTLTPIYDKKGIQIISYLLICRDITNHRKVEEEIELKYIKIKEVYKSIGVLKRQFDYIFDFLDLYKNYYHDIKSIGDFIVTSIIMLTQVDACIFRVYNKEKNCLKMISNFGLLDNWEGKKVIKFKNSLAEKAFKNNTPLKILDITKEPLYNSPALARKNNISSLLIIPLQSKGEFLGSISLYTKPDKKLQIFENDFIEKYAKIIELIVSNVQQ